MEAPPLGPLQEIKEQCIAKGLMVALIDGKILKVQRVRINILSVSKIKCMHIILKSCNFFGR